MVFPYRAIRTRPKSRLAAVALGGPIDADLPPCVGDGDLVAPLRE